MPVILDGLVSFFASHHAIRAETVLSRAGFAGELIPGPKELSPNCGIALRFEYARREDALALLAEKRVQIDGVCPYTPRTAHRVSDTASAPRDQTRHDARRKRKWLPQI